jgi:hypothetical protein
MGTFHHGKGDLHGITVVVDTQGPEVWIGRCDTVTPEGVILLGADRHEAGSEGAPSKEAWVGKAARLGVWPRHDRVLVPAASVVSIRPLSDVAST